MSSVLRTDVGKAKPFTKFTSIKSLSYSDNVIEHIVLIPFSYNNGILDIAVQDGSLDMINNGYVSNYTGGNYPDGFSWRMVKLMGGEGRVTSLGPNFLTWITAYLSDEVGDTVTNVTLQVAPVMTRVQQSVSSSSVLNNQYAIRLSTNAPKSDEYIIEGNEANNYFSVWVFKTPITVKFTYNGNTQYATLYTQFTSTY